MAVKEPKGHDFIDRLDAAFGRIAGWSFDHRILVSLLALGVLAGSVAIAATAQIDSSYEAYFSPTDETYLAYETYRDDFGSDEVSFILYTVPDAEHGVFEASVVERIARLTEALEDEVPFIYEVRSLTNFELMVPTEDGLKIVELADELPLSQEALLELRDRYLAKPSLVGGLLTADARHGAISIEMDRSSTDPLDEIRLDPEGGDGLDNLYPQATDNAIEAILARPEYAGIRFHHSGDVPLNALYNVIIGEESTWLGLLTSAAIALLLLATFRSFVGTIGPVLVVQLSVVMSVAFIVVIGWKLDMSFSSMPTLITAIGVAHSVHILSGFRVAFRRLGDRRAALVETLSLVGTPCLLTSVTTAVGFLSMSSVPIKSISQQGVYASFGVMAAFFLSLTLLMSLLSFGRRHPRKPPIADASLRRAELPAQLLGAVATFVVRRRVAILVVSTGLFVLSGIGMSRVVADSNWIDDFSEDVPHKQIAIHIEDVMGGLTNIIAVFDTGTPDGIKDPAVLREIDRIQQWADEQELVRKTHSIVDVLKDLNQTFHDGDPAWYRIPESRELVAQYLIMYESAGGTEASSYVTPDYERATIEMRLRIDKTSKTAELVAGIEALLEERPLEASALSLTGIGALWVKLLDYIVTSQIQGFLTAFAVIAAMMCMLLRSVRTGLIAMVPNLSPVFLTLGFMGWAGILLDYSKVSIAAVAMGIAVDDTIHLIARFRHEFEARRDYEAAFRAALGDVGRALAITSVALIAGFLMLQASVLDSTATRGLLLAGTIATALLADFLLLPALVLTLRPFGPEGARARAETAPLREAA